MKIIFLISQLVFANGTIELKAKITAFDQKTVTMEIVGEKYKFKRDLLGPKFKSIKPGQEVTLLVDHNSKTGP